MTQGDSLKQMVFARVRALNGVPARGRAGPFPLSARFTVNVREKRRGKGGVRAVAAAGTQRAITGLG